MSLSGALRFPAASPWKLARRGQATAYLSARQAALLVFIQRRWVLRRPWTLEALCRATGIPSRGQAQKELARLRQLELIAFRRPRRGPHGQHRLWIPRRRWALVRRLAGHRLPTDNDSASTPSGFISAPGVARAELRRAAPPRFGRAGGLTGPRRGHDPPRVLYAECPAGHRARAGRTSWTRGPSFRGAWQGFCRRCDRPIEELVDLVVPAPPPRALSAAELEDPELRARRVEAAWRMIRDPETPAGTRAQLLRDYGPPAPAAPPGIRYTLTRRYRDVAGGEVVRHVALQDGLAELVSRVAPRGDRMGGPE